MIKKAMISVALAGSFLLPSCISNTTTSKNKSYKFTPRRGSMEAQRAPRKAVIQTGQKPAWVDGNSMEFANHTYLTAVGFSKSRKQAEENARMEMSQIFNTKIKAVRNSVKKAHAVRKDGKVKTSGMEFNAETKIKNETEAIFAGLQLSRYWKDSNGMIYVLATINKRQVLPPLREKMMKMDRVIDKLVMDAKSSSDKLLRVTKLNKALEKAILREYYNSQVAILSSMGQTVKTEYGVEALALMLDSELEKISIAVSVSGEGNKNIRYAILKALGDLNLKTNTDVNITANLDEFEDFSEDASAKAPSYGKNVDVVIMAEVSFKALDRGDAYKWVSGEVNLSVKNNKSNKIYNTVSVKKRLRRNTLQEARRMTGVKLVKALISELNSNLINILGSDKK